MERGEELWCKSPRTGRISRGKGVEWRFREKKKVSHHQEKNGEEREGETEDGMRGEGTDIFS